MSVLTEHINGRYTKVSGPPMHTFKDSGIAVKLHKIPTMTSNEIIRQVRRELADSEPQPPIYEVDYGTGVKVKEPNRGHEVYQARLAAWEAEVSRLANDRLFKLAALAGVEVSIGAEERATIERTKRYLKVVARIDWQDDPELTAEENEQYFYVRHVCCATPEDIQEFYTAIAQRSQPTEAAIEAHKATFPGDV